MVLDNGERGVGGAVVSLEFPGEEPLGTETTRDGRFLIEAIPHSGAAHLRVDATVATLLGVVPRSLLREESERKV